MSNGKLPRRQGLVRRFILESFDDEGLEVFCFDYFPDALKAFSSGMSFSKKTMVLVRWCEDHGRFDDLIEALKTERPATFPASLDAPLEVPAVAPDPDAARGRNVTALQADELAAEVGRLARFAAENGYYLPYQTIYAELRTRFSVSSYKRLKQVQFNAVMEFLREWRDRLAGRSDPPMPPNHA